MYISITDMLNTVEQMTDIGHWTFDTQSGEVFWSLHTFRIYGYQPGEIQPSFDTAARVFAPPDRRRLEALIEKVVREGQPYDVRMKLTRHTGEQRMVRAMGRPWLGVDGEIVGLFGTIADITAQDEAEEHYRRLSAVVQATPEGIVITDPEGQIKWVNKGFERLSGYTLAECQGKKPGHLLQGPGTDPDTVARIRSAIRDKKPLTTDILNYNRFGDPYWLKLIISPRFDENGNVTEFMAMEVDISDQHETQLSLERQRNEMELISFKLGRQRRELQALSEARQEALERLSAEMSRRERLEEELRKQANTDELTGLSNRRAFFVRARDEVRRSQRYGNALSVISLDIDHFKAVNDTHGHQSGDEVIREIAALIRASLRQVDFPGRVGGEEFAVLLPETEMAGALIIAERLRERISEAEITFETGTVDMTCSLGVSSMRRNDTDILAVLRRADAALYRAKANGRDRVECDTSEAIGEESAA